MKNNEELLVYADWFHEPKIIGTLYCIFGIGCLLWITVIS